MEELPARAAPRGPRHVRRAVRRGPVPHRRLHLLGARRPVRGDPDEHPPRGAPGGPGAVGPAPPRGNPARLRFPSPRPSSCGRCAGSREPGAMRRVPRGGLWSEVAGSASGTAASGRRSRAYPRGSPREPGAPVICTLPTGRAMRREADMNRGRHVAGHLTGWVLDLLPARDGMEIWFRTAAGDTVTLFAPFRPSFAVAGRGGRGATGRAAARRWGGDPRAGGGGG